MLVTAKTRRDPFTFSLGGTAGINACTFVPAISDSKINQSLDEAFRRQRAAGNGPSALVLKRR